MGKLPALTITPPSPEAANLGRYAASPPSYYTGTPQITIPLLEVAEGPLRLPLSLSYHAAGNRVEDVASWVGLGWALNAGGVVTRAARGAADDQQPSGNSFTNFLDVTRLFSFYDLLNASPNALDIGSAPTTLLVQAAAGCADVQPDVFYFNFNGYTGQFSFDWKRQIQVKSDKDVRIEPIFNAQATTIHATPIAAGTTIEAWRITTEEGTVYEFAAAEYTNTRPISHSIGCLPARGQWFASSWYLSSVTDVNQEHHLYMDYQGYSLNYNLRFNDLIENGMDDVSSESECADVTSTGVNRSSRSYLTIEGLRPQRIRTSSGNTVVELLPTSTLRTDTLGLNVQATANFKALDRIVLRNAVDEEIKTFFFTYAAGNPTGRLTLQQVQEGRLGSGARLPGHAFAYSPVALPADIRSRAQDHWGFYNGVLTNDNPNMTLVPSFTFINPSGQVIESKGADRTVNALSAQAGILTKITYPTGGYSTYEYESNDYGYLNGGAPVIIKDSTTVTCDVSAAGGEEGIPTGGAGSPAGGAGRPYFMHQRVFRIRGREPRICHISYQLYTGQNVGGLKPSVFLQDSSGNTIIRAQAGIGASKDITAVRSLLPGRYTLMAKAYTEDPNNPPPDNPDTGEHGTDYAQIAVSWDSTYVVPAVSGRAKRLTGGLRIKRIQDFSQTDATNHTEKTFVYREENGSTSSSGVIYAEPQYAYKTQYLWVNYDNTAPGSSGRISVCNCWYRLARNRTSLGTTQGGFVGYKEVLVTALQNKIPYSQSVYRFTSPAEYPDGILDDLPFPPALSQGYKTGLLKEQIDYVAVGVNRKLARQLTTHYQFYETSVPGLAVANPNAPPPGRGISGYLPLLRADYQLISGHAQPDSTWEKYYDQNGRAFRQQKVFTYDANGTRIQQEEKLLPDGDRQITAHWYTSDLGASLYTQMAKNLHVLEPIESVTYLERASTRTITQASWQDFEMQGARLRLVGHRQLRTSTPLATTAYTLAATSGASSPDPHLEKRLLITAYDQAGNVTQLRQPSGRSIARVWGYGASYLIAEITGATYQQVAVTSFEPASAGRWRYDVKATLTGGHTGHWAYQLASSPVVRDSLPAGDYTLTCWATVAPTITVNNVAQLQGHAISLADSLGFRCYEVSLKSVPTQATLRVIGSGLLDELRLTPTQAQVVTYTYSPLVGLTSKMDAAGRLIRYEYDLFNRLVRTRDEQGRILSQQQYHYAGQ